MYNGLVGSLLGRYWYNGRLVLVQWYVGIGTLVGRQWLVVFYLHAYNMFDIKVPGLTQRTVSIR